MNRSLNLLQSFVTKFVKCDRAVKHIVRIPGHFSNIQTKNQTAKVLQKCKIYNLLESMPRVGLPVLVLFLQM